jgi:RNA polymerase sigma-70 factor (ECF subfamily)
MDVLKGDTLFLTFLTKRILEEDDELAFSSLFKLFYTQLTRFSLRIVRDHSSAEEVVADVFVNLWQKRKSVGTITHIKPYLYTAVKNSSINFVKAKNLSIKGISTEEFDTHFFINRDPDPAQEMEIQQMLVQMNRAIEQLPPQCRTVFKLIREDGLKYKEVASLLGISERTVETQLVRALKKLGDVMIEKPKPNTNTVLMRVAKVLLFSF